MKTSSYFKDGCLMSYLHKKLYTFSFSEYKVFASSILSVLLESAMKKEWLYDILTFFKLNLK